MVGLCESETSFLMSIIVKKIVKIIVRLAFLFEERTQPN